MNEKEKELLHQQLALLAERSKEDIISGRCSINDCREKFGLPPINDGLAEKRLISKGL